MHEAEITEIEAFLIEYKTLSGFKPPWFQNYGSDWQVRWGILDSLEIGRTELCVTVDSKLEDPSIIAFCRRILAYRIDLAPPN